MSGVRADAMQPDVRVRWMAARVTHGAYSGGKETSEHAIWRGLFRRAAHKTGKHYAGVTVCPRWHKFENFLADMGPRPSLDHSVERNNTFGNYAPGNCRWATRSEQQKNKKNTRRWTNGTFTGTLVECAAYVGIGKELAHWRVSTWGTFRKGESWHLVPKPA